MLPLSVVIMLGLMYTGIMLDTAIQEAPATYYVRREMPTVKVEPVGGYGEAFEEEFDDEPLEPLEPAEEFQEEFDDKPLEPAEEFEEEFEEDSVEEPEEPVKVHPGNGSENAQETSRNTCVVSVITGPKFAQFSKRFIDNKQQYCAKMGFQCHIFEDSIVTENRPLAWQKVHAIDTVLAMGDCHRLFWLDGDAIIMQPVKLPETTCNIALTKDLNGINTGVMIIKNTEWSDHFFHRVANTTAFDNHPWWEQAAIRHFIETERQTDKHIEYISQDIYNSYDIHRTPFIYHTAGCGSQCFHKWETAFNKITNWR